MYCCNCVDRGFDSLPPEVYLGVRLSVSVYICVCACEHAGARQTRIADTAQVKDELKLHGHLSLNNTAIYPHLNENPFTLL